MAGIKNSKVSKEVERLLSPLKQKDIAKYNIVQSLIDEVYSDPTIHSPETASREIENKLYKIIGDHIHYTHKNIDK